MFSLLDELFLLMLSDEDFFAMNAPDESIARAYAAAAAIEFFFDAEESLPNFPSKAILSACALPENTRDCPLIYKAALTKSADLEACVISKLLEADILRKSKQFVFFGKPILKIVQKRQVHLLRIRLIKALKFEGIPDCRTCALFWILKECGLVRVALTYQKSRKFAHRIEEIAAANLFKLSL